MGAIRQWALSIVVFLIFQGMMEILIPKGSIKKFIQLILGIAFLMIAVGPVLQFFRQDLCKTFLLQDFPELTETAAVAQEEYGKTQQEILEKQYADILAKQCSDVLAQEGKVLDEIQVACTSQGEIQAIAVRIRSPEEKQEGIQIDLGYIQVGDNSEPKPEWRQSFAKKLADCWGVEADTIEILEGKS